MRWAPVADQKAVEWPRLHARSHTFIPPYVMEWCLMGDRKVEGKRRLYLKVGIVIKLVRKPANEISKGRNSHFICFCLLVAYVTKFPAA
jgi:hypothetical protein